MGGNSTPGAVNSPKRRLMLFVLRRAVYLFVLKRFHCLKTEEYARIKSIHSRPISRSFSSTFRTRSIKRFNSEGAVLRLATVLLKYFARSRSDRGDNPSSGSTRDEAYLQVGQEI